MSLVADQDAFLRDVVQLLQFAWSKGYTVTGGELARTLDQQKIYVQTGRSKTMDSYHLKRLAVDLNFFLNGKLVQTKAGLQELGDFWERLNPRNKWGGDFNRFVDTPHFERHDH